MRVTNQMISDQVVGNLGRSLARFMELQNKMSTGRAINQPSDDPVGTIKDLSYRARLSEIDQFQKNISGGKNWLATVDVTLGNLNELISTAKELAVSLGNDTFDDIAREATANEVESLFQQALQAGNTQQEGRYLFSGHLTRTQPFRASAKGVVYDGDQGEIKVEIESGAYMGINTSGADLLTKPFRILGEEADLKAGIDGATLLVNLNDGRGVDLAPGSFIVTDRNLNVQVTVTIPVGTTDVNGVIAAVNAQLAAGGITNLTVGLGAEGNNLSLDATQRPELSLSTPLANLNNGTGLGREPHEFLIHNADHSIEAHVDLSSATTLGDAITEINAALAAAGAPSVTAALNATSTGIDITDATVPLPLGLTVSELSPEAVTAASLGIVGDISGVLNGTDLNPIPDFSIAESGVGETTAADLGLVGSMHYVLTGQDLDPRITLDTPLSLLNNGLVYTLGQVQISQGDRSVTLDLSATGINTISDLIDRINASGLDIAASINTIGKGVQIESTTIGRSLLIQDVSGTTTAYDLGIVGSPDVAGNLLFLIDALRDNDQKSIAGVIGGLEDSLNHILNERASAGAKIVRLETTESRLQDYNLKTTKLLSDTEDADVTKLVTDLAMQESLYTAALNAAARIIQPTLLNFLK